MIVCGRFEGIDSASSKAGVFQEVSVGDYVPVGRRDRRDGVDRRLRPAVAGSDGKQASGADESFSDVAADACKVSFTAALAVPRQSTAATEDLEQVVALLAGARDGNDLIAAAAPIARELRADQVLIHRLDPIAGTLTQLTPAPAHQTPLGNRALARLSAQEVVQVLAGDLTASPDDLERLAAAEQRSQLRLPVTCQGTVVGMLEAYRATERPWSRLEIRCARMIAHQLGAALERLERSAPASLTHPLAAAR